MYNFGHDCQDCGEEDIAEVFYQCAQCCPEHDLCENCFADLKSMAADPVVFGEWETEHTHHSFKRIEKLDKHSPVLVTENATYNEETPIEDICTNCLDLRLS